MDDLGWEIRLYRNVVDTLPWTLIEVIHEYKSFNFVKVLNDAGNGVITFDSRSLTSTVKSALVNYDCVIAFCKNDKYNIDVAPERGTDICFAILVENITDNLSVSSAHEIRVSGPGVAAMLDRSIVLPENYAPGSGGADNRTIFAGRPLDLWAMMRTEAGNRGGAGLVIQPYFTPAGIIVADSHNHGWDPALTMMITFEVKAGTGLYDLLKWAQSFGGFNFQVDWTGRTPEAYSRLFVYQTYRYDVSAKVSLHLGRHVLSASRVNTRESVMSHLYSSMGTTGSRADAWDNGNAVSWGRREFYWSGMSDYSYTDGNPIAGKIIRSKQFPIYTTTLSIAPNLDFKAFVDYDVFDRIFYDNPEVEMSGFFVVMGIAVNVTEQDETQEILLETPIETFQRRVYAELNREEQKFKYNSRIAQ